MEIREGQNMIRKKILIGGYFGCGNMGDDAILWALIQQLKKEPVDITVLSGDPKKTKEDFGVKALPRKKFTTVRNAIKEHDILVYAGGSLFQDATSVQNVVYYSHLIMMAKKFKKKVVLLGQGLGPLNTLTAKTMTAKALDSADAICVRDPDSLDLLKTLNVSAPTGLSADMAYLLEPNSLTETENTDRLLVGIAPRFLARNKQQNQKLIEFFTDLGKGLIDKGHKIRWISMHPSEEENQILQIHDAINSLDSEIAKADNPSDLLNAYEDLDGMIAMRLHAGIFAILHNLKPYMISYDPKVTSFANSYNLPFQPDIKYLSAETTIEEFLDLINGTSIDNKEFIQRRKNSIGHAKKNISYLLKAL